MKHDQPEHEVNALGQPIGALVDGWKTPDRPSAEPMVGHYCRLERLDADRHAASLWEGACLDPEGRNWTYSPPNMPADEAGMHVLVANQAKSTDPYYFAICDLETGEALGWATFMRIDPDAGSIEVGSIHYTPKLQRQRAGTEAMFLMMQRAFDELGYRRYEWKCHALNAPSRAAALRYGFTFEGIHRQAMLLRGRNRDTAWYSILDREWPRVRQALKSWLSDDNFDEAGLQKRSLSAIRAAL
ncbi:MAG: GNAT family protein [Pseudomonadota bacterium]